MTRITPLRLMIWQNSHLRFTEALTFISSPSVVFGVFLTKNNNPASTVPVIL